MNHNKNLLNKLNFNTFFYTTRLPLFLLMINGAIQILLTKESNESKKQLELDTHKRNKIKKNESNIQINNFKADGTQISFDLPLVRSNENLVQKVIHVNFLVESGVFNTSIYFYEKTQNDLRSSTTLNPLEKDLMDIYRIPFDRMKEITTTYNRLFKLYLKGNSEEHLKKAHDKAYETLENMYNLNVIEKTKNIKTIFNKKFRGKLLIKVDLTTQYEKMTHKKVDFPIFYELSLPMPDLRNHLTSTLYTEIISNGKLDFIKLNGKAIQYSVVLEAKVDHSLNQVFLNNAFLGFEIDFFNTPCHLFIGLRGNDKQNFQTKKIHALIEFHIKPISLQFFQDNKKNVTNKAKKTNQSFGNHLEENEKTLQSQEKVSPVNFASLTSRVKPFATISNSHFGSETLEATRDTNELYNEETEIGISSENNEEKVSKNFKEIEKPNPNLSTGFYYEVKKDDETMVDTRTKSRQRAGTRFDSTKYYTAVEAPKPIQITPMSNSTVIFGLCTTLIIVGIGFIFGNRNNDLSKKAAGTVAIASGTALAVSYSGSELSKSVSTKVAEVETVGKNLVDYTTIETLPPVIDKTIDQATLAIELKIINIINHSVMTIIGGIGVGLVGIAIFLSYVDWLNNRNNNDGNSGGLSSRNPRPNPNPGSDGLQVKSQFDTSLKPKRIYGRNLRMSSRKIKSGYGLNNPKMFHKF